MSRKGGVYILSGIVSFGTECKKHHDERVNHDYFDDEKPFSGVSNLKYGFNTNVGMYVDWIRQNSDYVGCKPSKILTCGQYYNRVTVVAMILIQIS